MTTTNKLIKVELNENIIKRDAIVENERETAMRDLINNNSFKIVDESITGPYILSISIEEDMKIVADVQNESKETVYTFKLSVKPLRRLIKDYMYICESYYETMKTLSAPQIETVDMARRALHNEGAEMLEKMLQSNVIVDTETSRRLFTLITIMHIR
ncbi:MAG: UPF0262 family protein [Alphaproteobacteria bacterium]